MVFLLLVLVSLAVFLTPGPDVPQGGPNDKVVHAGIFVVLTLSGLLAAVRPPRLGAGLAAYAALSEVLQATLPIQRDGDWRDWVADVTGVLLALVLGGVLAAGAQRRARAR
ncbi:MAG: VanZ family protein [Marmoricola sp.]|nr:VanZ family protein [Marmoricola sp.]